MIRGDTGSFSRADRATQWRWIAALWFGAALFEASQSIFVLHAEGKHGGELRLFAVQLITWLPWVLITPLIIGLGRKYPIVGRPTVRGVIAHLAALCALNAASAAWSTLLQMMFNPWRNAQWPTFWSTWNVNIIFGALNCLVAYALILTITYLVESWRNVAREKMEAARLNEELSRAQLAALRRQVEPHFMFNTLHSIAGLVREDRNGAAISMIVGLSEFLRRATQDSHRPQVLLAEEVEYLQRYIDIQKLRFGDRLRVTLDIPDDLLRAHVPSLLLQPLVENAIKHGVGERVTGGTVRVAGRREDGKLRLSVYNDGPAFPDNWRTAGGTGLANLQTRLQILHGAAAELAVTRAGDDGVEVSVTLPLVEG